MKTQKIQVKGNEKLIMKVDYSLFDNPESIKAFSECEDYREFDFNTFFKENPGLHKDIIRQIQTLINLIRSKRALELHINPDIDYTLTKEEKYLVNDKDLYDIGKVEIFYDNKDKDFIDGLHNNLFKEISDNNSAFTSQTKPITMRFLQLLGIKSAHIARYLAKFPEYERDGVVRSIHDSLTYMKTLVARMITQGIKDVTFQKINEASLLLRQHFYQAYMNYYFDKDKLKNAKTFGNVLQVCDDIENLVKLLKDLHSKKDKK